jgi:ketosteroid isomerase-like protein
MKTFKYLPLLVILCMSSVTAQDFYGDTGEIDKIISKTKDFSVAYINADYIALANMYALNGKLFPDNSFIIEGREAIKEKWKLPKNEKILYHKIFPMEIRIIGDYAYDYGYYEGRTLNANKTETSWKGKYVVVWIKVEEEWKLYLDIWNRVKP